MRDGQFCQMHSLYLRGLAIKFSHEPKIDELRVNPDTCGRANSI